MKVLICDDDIAALEKLEKAVSAYFSEKLIEENNEVRTFFNAFELCSYAENEKRRPDVIIMDINIDETGKVDGIDIAKEFLTLNFCDKFIFCTGKSSMQERIFDVDPIYTIIKPIKKTSVYNALEKAGKLIEKQKNKIITIKSVDSIYRIPLSEIRFAESQGRYVKIHTMNEIIVTINKLSNILELCGNDFIQSHKSYIINLEKIKFYNGNKCYLRDGTEIQVSRKFKNDVKVALINIL